MMNIERIKELAEEADFVVLEDNESGSLIEWEHNYDKELLKFVELIVLECADLCDRFQARDVGMQPAECAGAIRKMFGVEQ